MHFGFSIYLLALLLQLCLTEGFQVQRPLLDDARCRPLSSTDTSPEHLRNQQDIIATTAILRISYDGTRFTGWSAGNDGNGKLESQSSDSKRTRRRRQKMEQRPLPKGFVRSVEGVLRDNLAKVYGNVDPRRVIVEGCSRLDRGVHSRGMIVQMYCLQPDILERLDEDESNIHQSIPGKRLPHPTDPYDNSYFEKLPMNGNVSRLAFALNRMRPSDLQVTGVALVPEITTGKEKDYPFHPSLSSQSKTYEYRISTGAFQDPTTSRVSWHIGESLDFDTVKKGCKILTGKNNFVVFQGAPRGPDERKRYKSSLDNPDTTTCTLFDVAIEEIPAPSSSYFPGVEPPLQSYKIVIQGDRFLYKMVRFLVGALVALGTGKLECEDLRRALEHGSWEIPGEEPKRKEFQVAPPYGLVLADMDYGLLEFDWQPLRY